MSAWRRAIAWIRGLARGFANSLKARSRGIGWTAGVIGAFIAVPGVCWMIDRTFDAELIAPELALDGLSPNQGIDLSDDARNAVLGVSVGDAGLWERAQRPGDRLLQLGLLPPSEEGCGALDVGVATERDAGYVVLSLLPESSPAAVRCAEPWRLTLRSAVAPRSAPFPVRAGQAVRVRFEDSSKVPRAFGGTTARALRATLLQADGGSRGVFLRARRVHLSGEIALSSLGLKPPVDKNADAALTAAVTVKLFAAPTLANPDLRWAWLRSRLLFILGGISAFLGAVKKMVDWLPAPGSAPRKDGAHSRASLPARGRADGSTGDPARHSPRALRGWRRGG